MMQTFYFFLMFIFLIYFFIIKKYFLMFLITLEFMVVTMLSNMLLIEMYNMDLFFMYFLIISVCEAVLGLSILVSLIMLTSDESLLMVSLKF